MSLKSVKNKIKSIDKTRQVTKAMEAVSAVKMRKSQQSALATRPYALNAFRILRTITGSLDVLEHPLLKDSSGKRTCVIIVSADKGLAGNYGAALLKAVYRFFDSRELKKESLDLIIVGKKAKEHFEKRGYSVIAQYERWSDRVSFDDVRPIADLVKSAYIAGDYANVFIVSTHFISTLKQEVYAEQLLPLKIAAVEKTITDILPETGRFSELRSTMDLETAPSPGVLLEPSPEIIMNELVPLLFNIHIFHSVLEANASEHSARMIAMKNASDNAGEISRGLKLSFNKVRQAAITREVSEIVGGMESMKVAD
jgi:F-type H+-transporting ATPase subunit gamma